LLQPQIVPVLFRLPPAFFIGAPLVLFAVEVIRGAGGVPILRASDHSGLHSLQDAFFKSSLIA
jgi:hypothetical protein